jgi:hypothetical protein
LSPAVAPRRWQPFVTCCPELPLMFSEFNQLMNFVFAQFKLLRLVTFAAFPLIEPIKTWPRPLLPGCWS